MADLVIPNTFSPNTPAKADEVNANFDAVATHANRPPPVTPTSGVFLIRHLELTANSPVWTTSVTTDMVINNIPVVAGHTYGVRFDGIIDWASLATGARWDIYSRLNGVDHKRLAVIQPGVTGQTYWTIGNTVLWKPTVTASTDDMSVRVNEISNGADIQFIGGRTLAVFDYGVAV